VNGEPAVLGRFGQVTWYLDGGLDVWVRNPRVANKLKKLWAAKSNYDDGALFVRPASDLDIACKAIRARRKKAVTEAMRERGRALASRMRSLKENTRLVGVSSDE